MQTSRVLALALAAGLLAAAGPARAAFVRLEPVGPPTPSLTTYAVLVDDLLGSAVDVTIELNFVSPSDVDLGLSSAATDGNPFNGIIGASINTTTCLGTTPCWSGGGSGDPVSGPTIQIGTLTLASLGPDIAIFVNATQSRWSEEIAGQQAFTNAGEQVAVLPEPGVLLLVAVALTALAVLGRANARD